jgi:hypothetical protein
MGFSNNTVSAILIHNIMIFNTEPRESDFFSIHVCAKKIVSHTHNAARAEVKFLVIKYMIRKTQVDKKSFKATS